MNFESILKAILYSGEISHIKGLMLFYFFMLLLSIVINLRYEKIEHSINYINSQLNQELLHIIHICIHKLVYIILLIPTIFLLLPANLLLPKYKLNFIYTASIIISIFSIIVELIPDILPKKIQRTILTILLIISAILFIIGYILGYDFNLLFNL
ncbi:MAG: hypothetical protein ACOCV8_00290 [Spirochaetota bacterium]